MFGKPKHANSSWKVPINSEDIQRMRSAYPTLLSEQIREPSNIWGHDGTSKNTGEELSTTEAGTVAPSDQMETNPLSTTEEA
ncbi:hypothetical protein PCANC_27923 [Puccinia coronata f. sp. avenae]|uniref:Uncharacterized protein n=1 Tax=Puccinia coronata f. sp. avenae TaxID=200324 RepID=A0A2N5TI51_9BASI|nr:hypothetical protein PCANC_27923 [Puccinia coronata f. sp. avenae]